MTDWITVRDAVELTGYVSDYVQYLARIGKIEGKKVATVWLINRQSLESHLEQMRKLGRKPGPKTG